MGGRLGPDIRAVFFRGHSIELGLFSVMGSYVALPGWRFPGLPMWRFLDSGAFYNRKRHIGGGVVSPRGHILTTSGNLIIV